MPVTRGTRLGVYEILGPLGAGGMGEVFRARDTKLNRDVALKLLPEAFTADPERIARFQREAQMLAALNHPNIGGIYGLDEAAGTQFLVLELIDGETLAARLAAGPVPVDEALSLARQIVDALEAAHDRGIVHRDLKPANIALTRDGQIKVLDFGLAKDLGPGGSSPSGPGATHSPTLTFAATQAGVILGTAAYMAPEQAKGRAADKRSDVWAFGCVLYEMLAGRRAFEGEDVSDTLAAILRGDPDWSALPPGVPEYVRALLKRCLQKDRKARIPDLSVVRYLMTDGAAVTSLPESFARRKAGAGRDVPLGALIAGGVILAVVTASTTWLATRPTLLARPIVRLQVAPPAGVSFTINPFEADVALSPDSSRIVFIANAAGLAGSEGQLYVRDLNQLDAVALTGTGSARGPIFSPDAQWIAYAQGNDLKKVSIHGGPPVVLCRQCAGGFRGAAWGSDDTIVFTSSGGTDGVRRVNAAGGDPTVVVTPDRAKGEIDLFPEFLPGADKILFTTMSGGTETAQIVVRDLKTGIQKVLVRSGSQPHVVSGGFLTYAIDGTLRAVRFDAQRMTVSGNPIPILDRVVMKSTGAAEFSVSADGALVYVAGDSRGGGNTLAWLDREGGEEPIPIAPHNFAMPRLSPDGRRVALDTRDTDNDIWIWDFGRRILTRLTLNPAPDTYPVWTPDGQRIVFASTRTGPRNLFSQLADGTGAVEQLTKTTNSMLPTAISPDGKLLVVRADDPKRFGDLVVVSMDGDHAEKSLTHTPFQEQNADISPDGRWIAYESNESGRNEVYVHPFPDFESGRWEVSTNGGSRPLWARTGRELFYMTPDGHLMVVPLQPGDRFNPGAPTLALKDRVLVTNSGRPYDVSPDGRRILVIREAGAHADDKSPPPQMNVVINWVEELKAKVK